MSLEQLVQSRDLIDWTLSQRFQGQQHHILDDGTGIDWLADGVLQILPAKRTCATDLIVSCAIHGNETAPVELCRDWLADIIDGTLQIDCRLLTIIGNIPAMAINKRFCEENLNRLFSGKHRSSTTQEARRAGQLEALVDDFFTSGGTASERLRIHLDLHTAIRGSKYQRFAIYPYRPAQDWQASLLAFLTQADIQAVLLSNKYSGTFSCFSSHHQNAMALTVELGKALPFGANDLSSLKTFDLTVRALMTGYYDWSNTDHHLNIFKVADEVLRHQDKNFKLNLAADTINFTPLEPGYRLTEDGSASYCVNGEDHAVVFPNAEVPVGQRVALIIEPWKEA